MLGNGPDRLHISDNLLVSAAPRCTDNTTMSYSDRNVGNRAAGGRNPRTATGTAVGPG
ncbi:hypothetical protein CBM2633_U10013 [Cupriavidus taiwanensis]|nr:hypothetical protein CBM2633_U10013 [Cupriavidus taiwanensis]